MILAVDIGNTNIVLGCCDKDKILFRERVSTSLTATDLEYAVTLRTAVEMNGLDGSQIDGAIISSVVPTITNTVKAAVEKYTKVKCKVEAGTQPGTTLRLRGKGVPVLNGRGRGDQFVTVKVAVPRNLSESQKEALRRYAETMGELAPTGTEGGEEKSFFHKKKKK